MSRIGARLIYVNRTPEAMAWSKDFQERSLALHERRRAWVEGIYTLSGVPKEEHGSFSRGHQFSGLSWPENIPLPAGWFRPVDTPQLVRPKASTRVGKQLIAEMRQLDAPDMRAELRERFGMPERLFAGAGLFTSGVRLEEDGVWVTWASKDVEDELADPRRMRHYPQFADAGWEKVSLVDFIQRFGEDEV